MTHKDQVDNMVIKYKNDNGEDMYRKISLTYNKDVMKKAQPVPTEFAGVGMPPSMN